MQPTAVGSGGSEKCRVLIIDDEPYVLTILERMFSMFAQQFGLNLELSQSSDSAEIISSLQSGQGEHHLVVSDVRMPVVSGPEIYKAMKCIDPQLTDRFVFITGYCEDLSIELPGEKLHVLLKPFTYNQFTEKIQTLLPIAA